MGSGPVKPYSSVNFSLLIEANVATSVDLDMIRSVSVGATASDPINTSHSDASLDSDSSSFLNQRSVTNTAPTTMLPHEAVFLAINSCRQEFLKRSDVLNSSTFRLTRRLPKSQLRTSHSCRGSLYRQELLASLCLDLLQSKQYFWHRYTPNRSKLR